MVARGNAGRQCCRPQKVGLFSLITVLCVVIAISFLALFSFGNNSKAEPTLCYLSILHRHGERNPQSNTYPLDPYKNESFWPEGREQLMKKGMKTLFEVGKFLRRRYDGFIPSKYKASELLVISSYYDRCIMSGQALLAGLYPPVEDQIWNSEIHWQPISLHPVDRSLDNFFTGTRPCKKFEKEYEYVLNTILKKVQDESPELLDYVHKNAGLEVKSIIDISELYDALLVANEQGLKLPDWAWNIFPEKLKPLLRYSHNRFSWTPTMRKLFSGPLINDVVTNMKKKRDSKETFNRLLNLYSGHDTTVMNFLISLGVNQDLPIPNYGATVILELHEINNKYRVKILYMNSGWDKELTVFHIKGCEQDQDNYHDDMCDLDVFASALDSVRVTDFEKECILSDT